MSTAVNVVQSSAPRQQHPPQASTAAAAAVLNRHRVANNARITPVLVWEHFMALTACCVLRMLLLPPHCCRSLMCWTGMVTTHSPTSTTHLMHCVMPALLWRCWPAHQPALTQQTTVATLCWMLRRSGTSAWQWPCWVSVSMLCTDEQVRAAVQAAADLSANSVAAAEPQCTRQVLVLNVRRCAPPVLDWHWQGCGTTAHVGACFTLPNGLCSRLQLKAFAALSAVASAGKRLMHWQMQSRSMAWRW